MEHIGGFAVVDVLDDAEERYWAGRIALAVGWPQDEQALAHHQLSVSVQIGVTWE